MFKELPKAIQQKIIKYLEADNFVAAKELHDTYCSKLCSRRIVELSTLPINSTHYIENMD
jgi:hypothetical protein